MANIEFKAYPEVYDVTYAPQVYPSAKGNSGMEWAGKAEFSVGGDKWSNDNNLTMSGDPTTTTGATLRLNTHLNKDCNALWDVKAANTVTFSQRLIRGVHFYTYNNGSKHNPRITGVAMKYSKPGQSPKYVSLNYRSSNYCHTTDNSHGFPYIGTSKSAWWRGVAKKDNSDGDYFHQGWFWSGVVFHWECTWKSGSAIDNDVYIWGLRPICDAGKSSNPTYTNNMRVWNARGDV